MPGLFAFFRFLASVIRTGDSPIILGSKIGSGNSPEMILECRMDNGAELFGFCANYAEKGLNPKSWPHDPVVLKPW